MKNTDGGLLLLVKVKVTKVTMGIFHVFLGCTTGTKSRNASVTVVIIYMC